MVVCNRDRWVNRNKTSYLLPTLLPNLFTYRLQNALWTFVEYPKRTSHWGLQISEKNGEKSEGLNPFWNRLKVEVFLGQFGQHLPFTCVKPITNQQALLAGNHKKLKEKLLKKLVPKIPQKWQKSEWKDNRNMMFRGLKTEFPAT